MTFQIPVVLQKVEEPLLKAVPKMWAQTCNLTSPLLIVKYHPLFKRHGTGNSCGTLVLLVLSFSGCAAASVIFQATFIEVLQTSYYQSHLV